MLWIEMHNYETEFIAIEFLEENDGNIVLHLKPRD